MPEGSIILEKDPPAVCAQKLLNEQVDLSLIPIGAILDKPQFHIVGNHCIGANGRVETVELFSQCPLHEIENIYLDHDSRTSNLLVQVLASERWGIKPCWLKPERGYEFKIKEKTAGVIIGNRAFGYAPNMNYSYDLAEEWQKLTGLPFVFACWASAKKLDDDFVELFQNALNKGFEHLDDAIKATPIVFSININSYLTRNISFLFDKHKQDAMELFKTKVKQLGIL